MRTIINWNKTSDKLPTADCRIVFLQRVEEDRCVMCIGTFDGQKFLDKSFCNSDGESNEILIIDVYCWSYDGINIMDNEL